MIAVMAPEVHTHTPALSEAAQSLAPVSLSELNASAALLKRVDRKYMATPEQAAALVASLEGARVLEIEDVRHFHYLSDYFDTENLELYHDAATKRRRRYKLRERIYLDSGLHYAEVKTRGNRSRNVKDRLTLEKVGPAACRALAAGNTLPYSLTFAGTRTGDWVAYALETRGVLPVGEGAGAVARLTPSVRTAYTRTTLLLPESSRLTIDTELATSALRLNYGTTHMPFVVIETKSAGKASQADRLLWDMGCRPAKISKFGVAVALAYGTPANKWTRALRRIDAEAAPKEREAREQGARLQCEE